MSDGQLAQRITDLFLDCAELESLTREIDKTLPSAGIREASAEIELPGKSAISVSGLAGGAAAFLLAALYHRYDGNILYVTSDFDDAQNLSDDLSNILGEGNVCFFPPRQVPPYEFRSPTGEITGQRLAALNGLLSTRKRLIVAPIEAIIEPTLAQETFLAESLSLSVGQNLVREDLIDKLSALGFNRAAVVEEVGDFAVRGGLIDFFSASHDLPVRAEFSGDEIESLRLFDVREQRTVEHLDRVDLLPRREVTVRSETIEHYLEQMHPRDAELVRARFIGEPELPGLEWLAVAFGLPVGSLLDYLKGDDLVVLDGSKTLLEEARRQLTAGRHLYERAAERFICPPEIERYYFDPDKQFAKIASFVNLNIHPFHSPRAGQIDFACRDHPAVGSRLDYLNELNREFQAKNLYTVITCDNKGQAERLKEILSGRGINIPVEVFHIHSGFVSDALKVALLTDHQIFSRRFRRIKRRRYKEGVALSAYANLNPGDIVVHADHGIARFSRLETIKIDGRSRDCLLLVYHGGDKLYVPIEEFNRVSKYAGKEAGPHLTSLGGPSWDKLKNKTKKAIADMAAELLKLYAQRKTNPGFQFGSDTVWQRQLEASFIYEETPDQLKAIYNVKEDMEAATPTDRLICGDVGYGKTEVAVRAAFKAVENGKQVAVLVPTTILAQQHYSTFASRLSEFPIKIAMLSRFKTKAEQKEIIEQLAEKKIEIVIGTHRLLSNDVHFADLGLLVIDEEQRFGVRHKEKLRHIKKSVDTITLTATPIPRTLQLSLMGARDMTLIATSPRDRLPIQTEIVEFNPETIADAILREVDRDGQVFFVHNRVQSIEAIYRFLKKLLPQVEFGVAHGQMHEKELEGVMLAFLAGRYQVLLCTAIIESGLDIPSVNTIIINRADRFGLAQLYQLRGRVGRSVRRAYAYLMTPPYRLLSEDARKRLRAIETHSDLGSGFALAMRDLEIRGAGNILGAKQSGFIEEVGFDLYTKLLEEAVAELKGEKVQRLPDTKLEGPLELHLPDEYVDVNQQKVDIYRRLADAHTLDMIEVLREEVSDRFGRMPEQAQRLFDAAGLRLAASITGAEKVKVGRLKITVKYPAAMTFKRSDVETIRGAIEAPIEFSMTGGMKLTVDLSAVKETDRLAYMRKALDKIGAGLATHS